MSLVWLFKEHRVLYEDNVLLRLEIEQLNSRIAQLDLQLRVPAVGDTKSLMDEFKDVILTEQPFPENKIPEGMWLTPEVAE